MPFKCRSSRRIFKAAVGGFLFLYVVPFASAQVFDRPANEDRFRLGPGLDEEEDAPPMDGEPGFGFDPDEWDAMRRRVEEGQDLVAPSPLEPETEAVTAEPPKPPPGQLSVTLPYESSLSVTGRKVIRVELKNTHISEERAEELSTSQDSQSFDMEQELQARIQGTVARKTTINVNFDDTKDNVRDFSVVYKGDPDEVVQEAAFGDIVLSLPSTEFVNYNKQLFGIRTALRYKNASLLAIGSRTKGNTETRRFTGTTKRQQVFINDTAYLRRKFYDLTFPNAPAIRADFPLILPISDALPEKVWMEDTTGLLPVPEIAQDLVVTDPSATPITASSTQTVRMRQLSRGVDYTIDRVRGILTFVNPVSEDVRIAIDFARADGTLLSSVFPGDAVLIKDKKPENPIISQEIKRFYSAGSRNIVRDNGLGNFILRVLDENRETEIGPVLTPVQNYPSTIEMDFDDGIFKLDNRFQAGPGGVDFSDIYAATTTAGTPEHAVFSLEYNSVVRTYTLRPNIVLQSEKVEVDGRTVNRDLDYFIDYDIGIITFFNEDLIRESTVIEVTYEFAPFGGQLGETLVGARGTYDIALNKAMGPFSMDRWSVGSTVLYNFAAKPTGPPDIRSAPSSLLVTEGDTQLEGFRIGNLPVSTDFAYERARSKQNPNLFGKALIDSMEGIKQDDTVTLLQETWQVARNPIFSDGSGAYNSVVDFRGFEIASTASHLRWDDLEIASFDPLDDGNQRALQVFYDLNTENNATPEQASLVQTISLAGRDFTKKTTLEIEIIGAGAAGDGVDLIVDYGTFNEDADGDLLLDTEDEALDGILNLGEDVGWEFNGPGPDLTLNSGDDTAVRVGADNARLDSEDLNGDRVLTTVDQSATFTPVFALSDPGGYVGVDPLGMQETLTDLGFEGRRLIRVPLDFTDLVDDSRLQAVRQVRVTVRNKSGPGTPRSGNFILGRLSMVGISWEPAEFEPTATGSTMTVRAVNNKDDADSYVSLIGNGAFNDLYEGAAPDDEAREQALALDYSAGGIVVGSTASTTNPFGAVRNFANHDQFRFFLRRASDSPCILPECGTFFMQLGSETDYQQASIPVKNIPVDVWRLITIKQADLNNDGEPETWQAVDDDVTITKTGGAPNLVQVSQIKVGVFNNAGSPISDEIWINEIHVSNPHEKVGNAEKISFDTTWTNWMSFGGNRREVDRLFQTPTTQVNDQDRIQEDIYVNFDRLRFLPVTFRANREETRTPSAFQSNPNALVSFLEEGRVERSNTASTAKLILPRLPLFDFALNTDKVVNEITRRTEATSEWRVGATYSPPVRPDVAPGKFLTFRPLPNSITLSHSMKEAELRFPDAGELSRFGISTTPFSSTDLTQFTEDSEARLAFNPWDGFTFSPTYKLRRQTEKRSFRDDELIAAPDVAAINDQETPRSVNQQISVSGGIRLLKWLEPRYSYSMAGTETNDLPVLNDATGYTRKTIIRNSQGELSGTVQLQRVLPDNKFLQSMNINTSYKLENGDTYEDVPEGFAWRDKLWVGQPLDISSGTRTNLTDRRTFRTNVSWIPFTAYDFGGDRIKPLKSLSITSNFFTSTEDSETTGTRKRVESITWPDLILTINDSEDFFGSQTVIDDSRLVMRTNIRDVETIGVSDSRTETIGTDYQFKFLRKLDFSTSFTQSDQRDQNLLLNQITGESTTRAFSIQTRLPWGAWSYTPRYELNTVDARDAVRVTNDLENQVLSLQIYGDINRPFGLRIGRREIAFANRMILNSTLKWDRKRSNVNPQTNYLDIYSATLSGDYTISKNFRLALGGSFTHETHHPDFDKFDRTEFGIDSTLTIQF